MGLTGAKTTVWPALLLLPHTCEMRLAWNFLCQRERWKSYFVEQFGLHGKKQCLRMLRWERHGDEGQFVTLFVVTGRVRRRTTRRALLH